MRVANKSKFKLEISIDSDFKYCHYKRFFKKNYSHIVKVLEKTASDLNLKTQEISFHLSIVDELEIKRKNKDYRKKNKVTDVISLALYDDLRRVKLSMPAINLGDIFICKERMESQALDFKVSREHEFLHLLIHGYLHLLGFDHELSPKEAQVMEELEMTLVDKLISFV